MRQLTLEERKKIVSWFHTFQSAHLVRRNFRKVFHRRAPHIRTIVRWVSRAAESNEFSNAKRKPNKTTLLDGEMADAIVHAYEADPNISSRKAADMFNISKSTAARILRRARGQDTPRRNGSRKDGISLPKVVIRKSNTKMKCSYCNYTSRFRSTVKYHEKRHEKQLMRRPPKSYECNVCSAVFPTNFRLHEHLRAHKEPEEDMPYVRVLCPTMSSSRENVVLHVPLKDRPFSCPSCTESFTDKRTLELHTRSHTQPRPFECQLCPASYARMSGLMAHQRSHSKKITCTMCSAPFKNKTGLMRHMRKHRAEQLFKCHLCSLPYGQKRYLTKHLLQTHNYEESEDATPSSSGSSTPLNSAEASREMAAAAVGSALPALDLAEVADTELSARNATEVVGLRQSVMVSPDMSNVASVVPISADVVGREPSATDSTAAADAALSIKGGRGVGSGELGQSGTHSTSCEIQLKWQIRD